MLLLNSNTAALSTDFGSSLGGGFGTLIADLTDPAAPSTVTTFDVDNTSGFSLVLNGATANFPLLNCLFTTSAGSNTFMYTANGAVTVQDLFSTTGAVLNEIDVDGGAVACAVQQELGLLAIAGRSGSRTFISTFPIGTDPMLNTAAPEVVEIATSNTLTQIAFGTGSEVFFTTTNIDLVSVSDAVIEGGGDGGGDGGGGMMVGIVGAILGCFGLL